ncbi:hypothetical protein KR009_008640, partial [Drosophila setifemur]
VKLNANAQEFVPLSKKEQLPQEEANPANSDKKKPKTKLTLPWKGFPKRIGKVIMINDDDYMIVPRIKRVKKTKKAKEIQIAEAKGKLFQENEEFLPNFPPTDDRRAEAEEKRREQDRKVALEALKLVEQRRMRDPILTDEEPMKAKLEVHLSRSPVRFNTEERLRVDRLKVAKKERIERVLREMRLEKQEEKKQLKELKLKQKNNIAAPKNCVTMQKLLEKPAKVAATKRYIPTTKEWDEQCRVKEQEQAKTKENVQVETGYPQISTITTPTPNLPLMSSNSINIMPSPASSIIKLEDLKSKEVPRYCPPGQLLLEEKRKGNLTHLRTIPVWSFRRISPTPLKIVLNKFGKITKRYSIEQLLQLEPQPEEMEKPNLDESLNRLGFLCD